MEYVDRVALENIRARVAKKHIAELREVLASTTPKSDEDPCEAAG